MRALVLVAGLIATPAMAADQFDLACNYGKTPIRYRVDLSRGEACEQDCKKVWKLGAVTAGEIRLLDTSLNAPEESPQTIIVNRQTGALVHWIGGGRNPLTETAQCEIAPFSGFPVAKF